MENKKTCGCGKACEMPAVEPAGGMFGIHVAQEYPKMLVGRQLADATAEATSRGITLSPPSVLTRFEAGRIQYKVDENGIITDAWWG